jgi:hypothetical protein
MDVRRLAAIDMYGTKGTLRRRRLILAEFIVGVVGLVGAGIAIGVNASSWGWRLVALWFVGTGLNYLPLSIYALELSRPGRLEAELAGVDVMPELRRYSLLQFWVFVPLAFVVMAVRRPRD